MVVSWVSSLAVLFLPDTVGSRGTKKPPPSATDTNIQYKVHLYQAKVAFVVVVFFATKLDQIAFWGKTKDKNKFTINSIKP